MERPERPVLAWILGAALLVYSVVALVVIHRWISGAAAPFIALLLWQRHPRARFSTYVFLSVVGMRGAMTHSWPALLFAVTAILLLQLPSARAAWPSLRPTWSRR